MRNQMMRYSVIAVTTFVLIGTAWGLDDVPAPSKPAEPSITDQIKQAEDALNTLKAIRKKLEETKADEPDDAAAYNQAVGSIVSIMAIGRDWSEFQGAGIVIDEKRGDILTCYHLIGDDRLVMGVLPERDKNGQIITTVEHYGNRLIPAGCLVVLGWDRTRDLALLRWKTPRTGLKALPIAAQGATPGKAVFGIGCGNDTWWQFSSGTVRSVGDESYTSSDGQKVGGRLINTSVPVNPGDSGGALISRSGELLGVMVSYRKDLNAVSKSIDVAEIRQFIAAIRKMRKEEP